MDVSSHRAKNIDLKMIEKADIVFTMEKRHRDELLRRFPGADSKVYILQEYAEKKEEAEGREGELYDINDPMGGPREEYERTAKVLKESIERIVEYWLRGEKD